MKRPVPRRLTETEYAEVQARIMHNDVHITVLNTDVTFSPRDMLPEHMEAIRQHLLILAKARR